VAFFVLFCVYVWDWGWNSGLRTCKVGALPLETHLQSYGLFFSLQKHLYNPSVELGSFDTSDRYPHPTYIQQTKFNQHYKQNKSCITLQSGHCYQKFVDFYMII
jgi:hypothetical protein